MNIKKAIELLELAKDNPGSLDALELSRADDLSIEALKRLRDEKDMIPPPLWRPLPGETEEGSEEAQEIDPEVMSGERRA